MLKLSHLTKSFGAHKVLDDISLEFVSGTTTVILGSSGSGKSTLLRCIDCLELPEQGSLSIGTDIVDFSRPVSSRLRRKIRRHSALIFQNFQLFPHLSVMDNVTIGVLADKRMSRSEAEELAYSLLGKVGLSQKVNAYPRHLSGGQQQRVAIARALAVDPDFLLCDEPTSALDPERAAEVIGVLNELALEKRTLIAVTHNLSFVKKTADRVLFLDRGKIAFDGSPAGFFDAPTARIESFLKVFDA